jgi:hypothetical protein
MLRLTQRGPLASSRPAVSVACPRPSGSSSQGVGTVPLPGSSVPNGSVGMTPSKILLWLLTATVAVGAVTACSSGSTADTSAPTPTTSAAATAATSTALSQPSSTESPVAKPQPDPSCQREPSVRSISGTTRFDLKFVNNTGERLQALWLNYSGKRVFYRQIPAGTAYVQPTWITHPG